MPTSAPAWAPPLLAVQFLTRLPVPPLDRLTPDQARDGLARALGWFPLVGAGVGLLTAIVFTVAQQLWSPLIAAVLALLVEAWLTGAFHEDAVADFCDAFGGSARGDDARRIMKDSRIGSYGALGLALLLLLRVATTAALPPALAVAAIVAAASFGRLWAVLLLALAPPAPEHGLAGSIGVATRRTLGFTLLLTVPALAWMAALAPGASVAAIAAALIALPLLARGVRRRIAGSTGDCLGFAAYLGQLALLLAASAH